MSDYFLGNNTSRGLSCWCRFIRGVFIRSSLVKMTDLLCVSIRLKHISHSVTITILVFAIVRELHAVDVGSTCLARVGSDRVPKWISGRFPSIGRAKITFLVDTATFSYTPCVLDHGEEAVLLLPRLGILLPCQSCETLFLIIIIITCHQVVSSLVIDLPAKRSHGLSSVVFTHEYFLEVDVGRKQFLLDRYKDCNDIQLEIEQGDRLTPELGRILAVKSDSYTFKLEGELETVQHGG